MSIDSRGLGMLLLGLSCVCSSMASAQANEQFNTLTDTRDPFFRNAQAGYNLRSFYLNRDVPDNTATRTDQEAWAFGGALYARTGWWADTIQLGTTYYFSLPLHAPDDKDGTRLLSPGQNPISVLGELYVRARHANHTLTVGRQEIDMNYARASGVRSNRGDTTFVGRQDIRMVPVTYEAVLLTGKPDPSVNYYAGYVSKAKPINMNHFDSMGRLYGADGSDSGMYMTGVQWAPMQDVWTQAWYHQVPDGLRIAYLDGDYVSRWSTSGYFRLAAQYADQRSIGDDLITSGKPFSTSHAGLYGEIGWDTLTIYSAYGRTGTGSDLRMPTSSGPNYTQQLVRSFVRAGEKVAMIGVGANLDSWIRGMSVWVDYASGHDAVDANKGGVALPDETEFNIGMIWTYRQKGSVFDQMRLRVRAGWITDKTPAGDRHTTDYRIDVNVPISFL